MINEYMLGQGDGEENTAFIYINTRSGQEIVKVNDVDLPFANELTRLVIYKDPKGRKMARSDKADGQVLLHRHLFEIPKGSRLEWINGDTLDLRRENLQLVDKDGNVTPLKVPAKEESAQPKIKGVTFHKASQKWTSRPYWGSDRYSLGYFATKEEAEKETLIFLNEGPESPKLKRNQSKGDKK
jgi:hypothetical protein